ncbi:insulinase family protein [Brucella abortus]|nr:insulinase family protein [Brucella abortus]
MPLAIDILSDILTAPKFDEGELEREKQVIMQERSARRTIRPTISSSGPFHRNRLSPP